MKKKEDIKQIVDEHTLVMSLMNGVDSEQIIGNQIGMQHMVYSLVKVASHKEGNGYVFDPETTIGIVLEENKEIDELLSQSNLHYRTTSYIQKKYGVSFV